MKNKVSLVAISKIPKIEILKIWVVWLNNKKVAKFSSRSSKKHSINSQKLFIKNKLTNKENILFLIKFNQIYAGVVELLNIDKYNKNCEIRYLIGDPNYWNKGIAAESIKLATQYAFKKIKLKIVFADTHQDNIGSQKVLKKNNYKIQGKIKGFFHNQKESKDKIIFSKLKK